MLFIAERLPQSIPIWDGNIKGSEAIEGIYYYVLEMKTFTKNSTLAKPGKVAGFFYLYHKLQ